jgi:hypothetical protein
MLILSDFSGIGSAFGCFQPNYTLLIPGLVPWTQRLWLKGGVTAGKAMNF